MKFAITLAAALLSASSLAFAADNSGGQVEPDGGATRDEQTTGSINTEGRTVQPIDREKCMGEGMKSTDCQSLGAETNPN